MSAKYIQLFSHCFFYLATSTCQKKEKIQSESQHHCDSDWNDSMMQTNMAMLMLQQQFSCSSINDSSFVIKSIIFY